MDRLSPILALTLALACGGTGSPCDIERLDITLAGTVDDLHASPVAVVLRAGYTPESIGAEAFEYLAQVLGNNAPTGSGSSAVFSLSGPPNYSMTFQLAGSRIDGTNLDVLGVMPQGLPVGEASSFSAIPRNAVLIQWAGGSYIATSAEGGLEVTHVSPLEGNLGVEMLDGMGRSYQLEGQLVVERTGPGC